MPESDILPRGLIVGGSFRLGVLRARGGMAAIYEGSELATDRHVAIKFLRSELTKVPELVEQFVEEGNVLTRLDHPNVIRGLGSGTFGMSPFIAMEFVSGPTLRERLRWGRPERDESLSILKQVAAGLDHAHDRGIIHRDIKPDNLIIDKNVVRIADFGIAHQQKPDGAKKSDSESRGGTVLYSAPEQFSPGGPIDRRTDVYSLGVLAYEMLTGKVPFTSYKPASTLNYQVPRAADTVLEHAFSNEPEKRFSSAGAFVQALEAAFTAFAPDSTPAPDLTFQTPPEPQKAATSTFLEPPPPPPPPRRRRTSILWLVVLAGLAAGAVLAWKKGWFGGAHAEPGKTSRVHSGSVDRPAAAAEPPFILGEFPREEATPPVPAGLLLDRVLVRLRGGDSPGSPYEVASVEVEARVLRTCENSWDGVPYVFREGEARGDARLHDALHEAGLPRVTNARFDFVRNQPVRLLLVLENPATDVEFDLVAGTALLRRGSDAQPQRGTCTLRGR